MLKLLLIFGHGGQDDCHCLNKTRCPDNCDAQCDPGWYGPSCHKVNIARGQITSFNGMELNGTSEQVTDGNTADSNCASFSGYTPSWQIQFEETRIITSMKIFWSVSDIPTGVIVVTVGDISCFGNNISIREVQITCNTPTEGNHVIIRNIYSGAATSLSLTICEVEIYECVDGFYGTSCSNRCDCGESELCDKRNGDCVQQVSPSTTVATTVNVPSSEASVTTTEMSAMTSKTPSTSSNIFEVTDTTEGLFISTAMTPSVTTNNGTTQSEETTDTTTSNTSDAKMDRHSADENDKVIVRGDGADETDRKDVPVAAIVVPCIIIVIGIVLVVVIVLRRQGLVCVTQKEDINEPDYAGLGPRHEDNYTTLTPPIYQNESSQRIYQNESSQRIYQNEQVYLGGRHTYVNQIDYMD